MTPLTSHPTPDWQPRWSPDGRQIVFYAYRSGNRDVWVMPATGGSAQQLTDDTATDWMPSWSPAGDRIAFASDRHGGTGGLWITSVAGGETQRLTTDGLFHDWSPDGQWLAIVSQGGLSRVAAQGGEPVPLSTGAHQPADARVSHDGRSIYYSVNNGPPEHRHHWSLSLSNETISQLTRLDGQRGRIGGGFAADGQYLYFTWYEDDGDIWVMDVETPGGR
jgi:Tol biopolymer transport system component